MYRPRRTSEFHEDASEDGALPAKEQTKSLMPDTATPKNKPGNNITVESSVALHTDKKWVQEQSEQLAEYLNKMVQTHVLQGFSNKFFGRGAAALREITVKQLVKIVYFFLQHIGRQRVMGTNHVEDITNALEELKYPYPVNKTWLMKPTAQHSFGHVIVMLDFLKDIAGPSTTDDQEHEFSFMEAHEQLKFLSTTRDQFEPFLTNDSTVKLDAQINKILFDSAAESFAAWDKEEWDAYAALQRKAGNKIMKYLSEQNELEKLDAELQPLESSEIDQLQQLEAQGQLLESLLNTQAQLMKQIKQINALNEDSVQNSKTVEVERKQLKHLQSQVDSHKQMPEEQLPNLVEDSDYQQIQQQILARAKKQLQNQVENYNKQAQSIALHPDILSATDGEQLELLLPLPLQESDIEARLCTLNKLILLLQECGMKNTERQKEMAQTMQNKIVKAEDKMINNNIHSLARLSENKNNGITYYHHRLKIIKRYFWAWVRLMHAYINLRELSQDLEDAKKNNSDLLNNDERLQYKRFETLKNKMNEYNLQKTIMEELHKVVVLNENKLEQLPSYQDKLDADS